MANEWVEAAVPLESRSIPLAPLEQYSPRLFMTPLLCFRIPSSSSFPPEEIYSRLRTGLSRMLVQIPVLAGRICNSAERDGKVIIRILPNAKVNFSFYQYTSPDPFAPSTYVQLKAQQFPAVSETGLGFSLLPSSPIVADDSPVFVARASFIDGGLLLAFSVSHAIADGTSVGIIQKIWARHTRESQAALPAGLSSLPFDEDRARLFHDNGNRTLSTTSPWKICDRSSDPPLALKMLEPSVATQPVHDTALPITPRCTKEIWYFSSEKLQELKRYASTKDPSRWISTYDVVAALIWQRAALARRLHYRGYPTARCCIPIDVRSVLQPPLHPDFVGNAVDTAFAEHSTADMERLSLDLLPVLAEKIHNARGNWRRANWESLVGVIRTLPAHQTLSMDFLPGDDPSIVVTDASRLPSYQLDWGEGLRSVDRFRMLTMDTDGSTTPVSIVCIFPKFSDGGLEVMTIFTKEVTRTLREDTNFTRFATYRCGESLRRLARL